MMARGFSASALLAVFLLLEGCNGRSRAHAPEVPRPDAVLDFNTLYQQNCAGCHGTKGENGPAYPLANPQYQALVDESTLRKIIAGGDPGTMMPAFAISAGGTLTDLQVNALVSGMRAAWWKSGNKPGAKTPPYHPNGTGDAARGQQVYEDNCALCHGDAKSPDNNIAGPVTDPTFLSLVSDEVLRTIVIAGRPDVGMPNWKGELPGGEVGHSEMTDQQVTDVVAWLSSQRPAVGGAESAANAAPGEQAKETKSTGGRQ